MAEMTGEQRLAAELRGRNILVNAAAGSGKTKVLTERIIGIVSDKKDPADIDSLLVVTFTKAAAKEMRERISNEMTRMSLADTGNKHLKKQLILLNYADITTIDAFCLNVVKSNFHRLDLDSSFSVMSESEAAVICDEIMDEVFEENYIRSDNGGFLNLVDMYSKNHDDTSLKDMIRAVYKFASSMPDIDGELTRMEELYDKPFGENVRSGENRYTDSMYTEISLSLDVIITSYQRMTAAFSTYTDDIKTLKKMETMIAGELMFFTDLKDKADKRQWNEASKLYEAFSFGRASSWAGIDDWVKDLREKCKDDLKSLKAFFGCKKLDDAAERITGIYRPVVIEILKLTREFSRKYNEKKKSISKFEFSDIERMCLSLLRDENGKDSDICINFREKYREILIDEYQDSNRLQDEIFSAISNGKNMFTVGDMKQSIYAFRNCDPTLFKDKADKFGLVKPAEDSESGRVSEDAVGEDNDENDVSNGAKVILSKNFRSSSECINAVNEIFANIMSEKYGEIDYNDEQRLNIGNKNYDESQNIPGLLKAEIDIIERDCKDANIEKQYAGDGYDEDGEGDSEVDTEKIRIEARFAAQRIKELKRSGYKVLDKNTNSYRPLENRDIAVLLRAEKSNDNASIYADELNKCGINAYAQSAGYFDKPEIRTILSLLKVVNNPLNDIPLIAVMCSLLYGIPEEDIARIHIFNKSGHIYENIVDMLQKENCEEKNKTLVKLTEDIKRFRGYAKYMPCDKLIWTIYEETGFYNICAAMPGGEERCANLVLLFDRARIFENSGFKGLFNFMRFTEKMIDKEIEMSAANLINETHNVVRIMSIHKSKGLEFPVVILSQAMKRFNTTDLSNTVLLDKELGMGLDHSDPEKHSRYPTIIKSIIKRKKYRAMISEEMRILYVALTRAREKLIVTAVPNSSEFDGEKYKNMHPAKACCFGDWIIHNALVSGKYWNMNRISASELCCAADEQKEENNTDAEPDISNIFSFKYKYAPLIGIKAKMSVTEMKRRALSEENDENDYGIAAGKLQFLRDNEITVKKPQFLEDNDIEAAQKGTIMHTAMQNIRLKPIMDIPYIEDEIKRMTNEGLFTEKEAEYIDGKRIEMFFKSDPGKRMLCSHRVYREVRFEIPISVAEVMKNTDFGDDMKNEKILLQGIIDCYFEENGETVLVDYKTDRYTDKEKIRERYSGQLEYYKRALETLTDKKVKGAYLYLFFNNDVIEI